MLCYSFSYSSSSARRAYVVQVRFVSGSSFYTGSSSSIFSATTFNIGWRAALTLVLLAFLVFGLKAASLIFACTASTFEAFDEETEGEFFSYKTPCLDSNIYICEGLLRTARFSYGAQTFRNRFHI